ncbi:MAG: hypothetical protein AB1805_11365 [Nitrospirota bacterium]
MKSHTIEIDDDVFQYLKRRAEPFEDTPNSVLRRELLKNGRTPVITTSAKAADQITTLFPVGTPIALQQILEVVRLIKSGNYTRNEATRLIARKHNVAQQTVQDKYGRQLGITADEFDRLLTPSKAEDLIALLIKKFPNYGDIIRKSVRV